MSTKKTPPMTTAALRGRIKLSDLLREPRYQGIISQAFIAKAAIQDRRATAYHEAGHAVSAICLDHRFTEVVCKEGLRHNGAGFVQNLAREKQTCGDLLTHDWRDYVRMLLAGPAAERIYYQTYCCDPGFDGGKNDRQQVREQFLAYQNDDPYFSVGQANMEAEALVVAMWPKIEAVATSLMQKARLCEDQVYTLCKRVRVHQKVGRAIKGPGWIMRDDGKEFMDTKWRKVERDKKWNNLLRGIVRQANGPR